MPARRAYTAAELRVKLAHERALSRVRSARYRARHGDAVALGDGDGDRDEKPGHRDVHAPPQTPPVVSSSPPEKEKEAVARAVLRGFRDRGYVDDARFWRLVAEKYPGVDVELEALKIREWLQEPRNARRRCSKAFLDNWLGGAHARTNRTADQAGQPVGAPRAISPKGIVVVNGTPYAPPAAYQRNVEKTYKSADDYTSEDLVKSDEARRRVLESLPARLRGKWNR